MKQKIIQDHKEKAINSTTACLALLVLDADTEAKWIGEVLDIPIGTPSSIKTRFNQNFYKKQLDTALEYLSKLENSKPILSEEAKLADSWAILPQVEIKKELSAPISQPVEKKKSYSIALEAKKREQTEEIDPSYKRVIDHLNEFGLYKKLTPLIEDEGAIRALSLIVEFTEKNSGIGFKLPKIFTYTLKAIVNHSDIEESKSFSENMRELSEIRKEVQSIEEDIENLNQQVLEMFKSGNSKAMDELYVNHKENIAHHRKLKERYQIRKNKVDAQTDLIESILSSKIPVKE